MPGWHQPETVLELLINKERWNGLGQERQSQIEETCDALLQSTLGESASLQAEALAGLSAKDSVRVLPWPEDVLQALRDAWSEIAKEEGIRDYFFKEVLQDIEAFQAKGLEPAPDAPANAPAPQAAP
jgi:TRAP-type mannitol/chloroaromatic compound transport system substrate-binding protein